MSPNSYWANQFCTELAAYWVQNSTQENGFVTQIEGNQGLLNSQWLDVQAEYKEFTAHIQRSPPAPLNFC